jgi:hypothetical protein
MLQTGAAMKLTNCVLLSAMLVAPLVRAEETVQWGDLPKIVEKAQRTGSREFTVVTKTGEKKKGRQLLISTSGLEVGPNWRRIPRDEVVEIQVRHRGRLSYFGRVFATCEECLLTPVVFLMVPLDLAYGAAATPPMLVVESVRRLMPPKVLKIAP